MRISSFLSRAWAKNRRLNAQEPLLQTLVYAMTEDVEEPVLAAGLSDLDGHCTPARGPSDQRSDIDDR